MTLISKSAAGLSIASCITDIHKSAKIASHNEYVKTSANSTIRRSISAQKANRVSYKDAQRKNWLAQNAFGQGIEEGFAKVKGYIKGFGVGVIRCLPNFILSAVAMFTTKHKTVANISAIGLALLEGWDFIKNSTGLFQKTDYLE